MLPHSKGKAAALVEATRTAHRRLMSAFGEWLKALDDCPGWREWNRAKISRTLNHDDPSFEPGPYPPIFKFPGDLEKQHAAIMGYLMLSTSLQSLRDCEYYFRRYPFHGLPVSKPMHLRYVCEMYFSRVFEFRERLTKCVKAMNETIAPQAVRTIELVNAFRSEFRREINARNSIHHDEHFDDLAIDNLNLTNVMIEDADVKTWWRKRNKRGYRRATIEWARRVRERSQMIEVYLEEVASMMLTHCDYLTEPREAAR
jgi:hypothetical protein